MSQTNHGSIEFLKFPNPQYPGDATKMIKKWLRDSWARRKIVALQQTIADIVVPTKTSQLQNDSGFITSADIPPGATASSTTPLMDGTAAVGTENAFARGDHRHPTDTSRQAALSTAQMAAVNSGITADDLAVNDASVLCKATPIVPTLTDGSHYSTVGGCWYYKVGCRVHVHVGVTDITSGTTADLWYMPEGYRPYSHVSVVGTGNGMTNYSRLRISPQGRVFVNANAISATVDVEYDAFQ